MESLVHIIQQHGPTLVFFNVLLERLGIPIPAMPTLVLAGAGAAQGGDSAQALLLLAVLACVLAECGWYALGRRYGSRVLRLLCSVSLSADSCVRRTSTHFERWGPWTMLLGKFIPGVSTLAPPLAGVVRMPLPRFVVLSAAGSGLWAGVALAAGVLFSRQVEGLLQRLEQLGVVAGMVIGVLLAAYVAFKWWERRRFFNTVRTARISVKELRALMDTEPKPLIFDLRARAERATDGRAIPGARHMDLLELDRRLDELPKDRDIVFYCTCPNEASAASAAKALLDLG